MLKMERRLFRYSFSFIFASVFVLRFQNCAAEEVLDDDTIELPSYNTIYNIAEAAVRATDSAWRLATNLGKSEQNNLKFIHETIWPEILMEFSKANLPIKMMDSTILFKRKPSVFMDSLLGFSSFRDVQKLQETQYKDPFRKIKIRWIEISSASEQMQRFYRKRIKDILNGGSNFRGIVRSIENYRAYIWKGKSSKRGKHGLILFKDIAETAFNLLFLSNRTNAFEGLRQLLNIKPDVLSKPIIPSKSCSPGHDLITLEPNGNDVPFYLLFYLCLVDIKHFLLTNYMHIYNKALYGVTPTNSASLVSTMNSRIRKKVEMFDAALGRDLISQGSSVNTFEAIANCDPPPAVVSQKKRNFTEGISYEKLTNFIKVFVSPERSLHKSGTCRVTCDLLDATYQPCPPNNVACQLERERECLLNANNRCDSFDPVCPPGAYQCQNSSGLISVCPSSRFDRLYEYIDGHDVGESFHFGPRENETACNNDIQAWTGGWRMEGDVLVSTPHFCEICICYCFEPIKKYLGEDTTRYFSLRSMRSKLKENRVIVGVKFHRVKDQIHIAVADGELLVGKEVNASTIRWRYPKYEKNPLYVARLSKDFRSLNLDDVTTTNPERVVTGVRFYADTYTGTVTYNYIGLEILTHRMEKDRKIIQGTGEYTRNTNSTISRLTYQYPPDPNGPDDPINSPGPALPDSATNMYIVFRGTSLEKDAAQSTIPYFDSQPLLSPEFGTLKGLGVYHKSYPGYGGFLAFKVIRHKTEMEE